MGVSTFQISDIYPFLLILSRVMAALITLPGFGSLNNTNQVRLLIAVSLSLVMTPILQSSLPAAPDQPYLFFAYIVFELFVGVFIGTIGKMLLSALNVAGTMISYESGLTNAFILNPVEREQSSLPSVLLSMTIVVLFFVSDIHHIAIRAIYESYKVFNPANLTSYPFMGEHMMIAIVSMLTEGFILAAHMSAPIIIIAILYFIGMGLLNRLMPQLHVFFVGQPFQIYMGFLILALILVGASTTVLERLARLYESLWSLSPGA